MKYLYQALPDLHLAGRRLVGRVVFGLLVLASAVLGGLIGFLLVYSTDLPEIGQLDQYRPSSATELYDDQGRIIATFALQRRVIVTYDDFPEILRAAVLSIEDKDFEEHWGVNLWRVMGALYRDITVGRRAQGASTITMQLARNLFLSPERSLRRKVQEVLLSIQIERRFTKPQIFTMYANQIYLGHGVYGFEAGAQYYFNKHAKQLTVEEAATLAALPKSPTDYSPISHPDKAIARRNLVINAMLEDGKIKTEQAARAKETPITLNIQTPAGSIAPYFAEEVRRYLERKYGSDRVHTGALRVYTSLDLDMQKAANKAVLDGLAAYERRHGWQGRLKNAVAMAELIGEFEHPDWRTSFEPGDYVHALVMRVNRSQATLKLGRYAATLNRNDISWTGYKTPEQILTLGDIVYVQVMSLTPDRRATVRLEQDSGAQGALLALDNLTGDVKALVGGRDFGQSKFNRVTQALRQVGSMFKPYVYAAAVEAGEISPADMIPDAPTTFLTASGPYVPRNYDGRFEGNITIERAFAESRNIPALKLADRVGMKTVVDYARKFGITSPLPLYLPVALGSAEITLYEQVAAFSAFPGDGVRVVPRYIRKVSDYEGKILEENFPEVRDVINVSTARLMTSMLRRAVLKGTAKRANSLNHAVAGKTGTTNDNTDAWFIGFSPSVTCGVWVGYDEKKSLGPNESGAQAALPVWVEFMKVVLKNRSTENFAVPPRGKLQTVASRR
jgi:penicillin-binding protein 1A